MDEIIGNNILLITSNDLEKTALQEALREQSVNLSKTHQALSSRLKVGVLNGYPIMLLSAERGSFKADSVGVLLPEILLGLKPQLVILAGFSYGKRDSVNLHDVVVSREIVSLVDFKGTNEGIDFRSFPRLSSLVAPELVGSLIKETSASIASVLRKIGLKSELRVGPIVSGEILAEGEAFAERLFAKLPDILGGDMEGQSVATHCAKRNIPWLILKSPSDFGGGTGGTTNGQTYSAKMSAVTAIEFAKAYVPLKKLHCPQSLLSVLSAGVSSPFERLLMTDDKHAVRGTFKYASRIKKFISKLSLEQPYDQDFQDHLIGVIKEIAENAAKHEKSPGVDLRGDSDGVVIEYEGKPFNPIEEFAKMKVSGGGKGEFDSFTASYAADGPIVNIDWSYVSGKNRVRIRFVGVTSDLRRNFFCSLSLDSDEMREYSLYTNPNFSELAECDTVWLNVEDTIMSLSDGMLLGMLIQKFPKTVNQIIVRGCPKRLIVPYTEKFKYDIRVQFL